MFVVIVVIVIVAMGICGGTKHRLHTEFVSHLPPNIVQVGIFKTQISEHRNMLVFGSARSTKDNDWLYDPTKML
jgi:hypothetical protein